VTTQIAPAPVAPVEPPVPTRERWHRHPSDVARLVASLVVLAVLWTIATWRAEEARALSFDIVALFDNLGSGAANAIVGLSQLVAVVAPVAVTLGLLVRRRLDLLALFSLAALVAAVFMALTTNRFQSVPIEDLGYDRVQSWFVGGTFPSSTYLAALTAVVVTAGPWMRRPWRRAGWLLVAATTVARVVTATEVPLRIGVLLALGAAAGSATLVVFGAPRRRVDPVTVSAALAAAGVPTTSLVQISEHGGVPTFRADVDGAPDPVFVKVLGRDERDTDLLLSAWNSLRLKGLGDDSPRGRPQRVMENEALALALARGAGASAPEPLIVTRTEQEASVLATTWVDGTPLVDLGEGVADTTLVQLWGQVQRLQRRRIAHRALHPSNIIVGNDGVVLVDLRRADLDASDEVLGADLAELLASLTLQVGLDRAVSTATEALPARDLARALPFLQLAVLSPAVRNEMRRRKPLIDELRARVAHDTGVTDIQIAPVSRITLKGAVSVLGSLVLAAYVFTVVANWDETWSAFTAADTVYIVPILALAAAGFFAGALSMLGAATVELPFLRTSQVMFAQSFLNRFTPANAGGMAMRMRYLQLNGLDGTSAAAAVGLTSAASGTMQVVLIVVFFIWGGTTDRFDDFDAPDVGGILLAVIVIGAVVGAVVLSSWGRRVIVPRLRHTVTKLRSMLAALVSDPGKMAQLFGGALLSKLTTIVAFWLTVLAFDVEMSFARAGALYMIANTIGSAVPTPGGVGGIEAALTAVLLSCRCSRSWPARSPRATAGSSSRSGTASAASCSATATSW
jgi:glycosyltransferase 2 family protein